MAMKKDNRTLHQVIEDDMDNAIKMMRDVTDFSDDQIFDEMIDSVPHPIDPFYRGMLERKLHGNKNSDSLDGI